MRPAVAGKSATHRHAREHDEATDLDDRHDTLDVVDRLVPCRVDRERTEEQRDPESGNGRRAAVDADRFVK
ncbi:MAG: hypothetical protein R2705_08490 [Ilumatobacteraceae bacterium]